MAIIDELPDSSLAGRWIVTIALTTALSVWAMSFPLNHDVGWWLYIARAMLHNEVLYRDLIEINPPLMAYVAMFPTTIADVLGAGIPDTSKGFALVVTILMAYWAASILNSGSSKANTPTVLLLLVAPVLGFTAGDWGQREHLMLSLAMPFLSVVALRGEDRPPDRKLKIAVGIVAGIGFSLKPHFVLILLGIAVLGLVQARSARRSLWQHEVLAAVSAFACYYAWVLVAQPEYIGLLQRSSHLYADFADRTFLSMVRRPVALLLVLVLATAVFLRGRVRFPNLLAPFLVFAGASFVIAVLQGKGWSYHYLPAIVFTIYAASLLVWSLVSCDYALSLRGRALQALLAFGLITGVLVTGMSTLMQEVWEREVKRSQIERRAAWLDRVGATSIAMLSDRVPDGFPLALEAGVRWDSPFPSLWWLRARYGSLRSLDAMEEAPTDPTELGFRQLLVSKVVERQPDFILVDVSRMLGDSGEVFPYLDYFEQEPCFATLMHDYEAFDRVDVFRAYRHRRVEPTGIGR